MLQLAHDYGFTAFMLGFVAGFALCMIINDLLDRTEK